MKIAINSKTTGKFRKDFVNNREHIVTDMIPIVGNSVMNRGFYPLAEVQNTFEQLHFLPAPNGHPKVGNELVSAFHPLATNAFNIGGMVRNPKMDGDKVINEFWLDIDIANQSNDGKELIRRIEAGETVGVSTGLSVKQNMVANGQHNGQDFDWTASNIQYDHVAILLNEKAAGAHVGTALTNSDNGAMVVNCAILDGERPTAVENEGIVNQLINKMKDVFEMKTNAIEVHDLKHQLRVESKKIYSDDMFWSFVFRLFPTENVVIFEIEAKTEGSKAHLIKCTYTIDENDQVSLNEDKVEVVMKEEFVEVDGDVNVNNSNPEEDNDMSDKKGSKDQDVINSDKLNVENAINLLETKGFKVNTKEEAEKLEFFTKNKAKFESIINAETDELKVLRDNLVANSDMTDDDVKDMGKPMLTRLSNSINPPQDYSVSAGVTQLRQVANSDVSDADFEDSYTPNYDDAKGGK